MATGMDQFEGRGVTTPHYEVTEQVGTEDTQWSREVGQCSTDSNADSKNRPQRFLTPLSSPGILLT